MFVKFITSRLLRVIVCAAVYNAMSCFVTLYNVQSGASALPDGRDGAV